MIKKDKNSVKYMNSVKVGPKGQIVIPKEVRNMFEINPGDTVMILADSKKGIAIEKYDYFEKIADAIFAGKSKDMYPEQTEEDSIEFASNIKKIRDEDEEEE